MTENSVFCNFLVQLYGATRESAVIRFLTGLFQGIGRVLGDSLPGRMLGRKTCIDDHTEVSVFYACLRTVWNTLLGVFGAIYRRLRRLNEGGLNYRFYMRFVKTSYLFHLETLLMLCIFAIYVIPHDFWNNLYATVAVVLMAAVYCLCLYSGRQDIGRRADGLWFPMLFFIFATLISVIKSPTLGDSIRVLVFFFTSFLLCLIVYGTMTAAKRIHALLEAIMAAMAVASVLAVFQRITGAVSSDAALTDMALNKDMPGRAFGTLGNPNNFAEFLILFIPFALAYVINQKTPWKKGFGLFVLALSFLALLLTYSRSGWLAFAISVLFFVALYDWRLLSVFLLVGICFIPLLPRTVLHRILTIGNLQDSSSAYRVDIWRGSLRMLRDGHWFAGVGLGPAAFSEVYPAYAIGKSSVAPHTHMQFMEMMAEMGILGFVSLLWYSISLVRRSAVAAVGGIKGETRTVLCAAAAVIAGSTGIGFAEYTWFYPRAMLAFFIAAGIAMAAVRNAKAKEKQEVAKTGE